MQGNTVATCISRFVGEFLSLSLRLPLSLLGRYREKMAGSAVTPAA